MADLSEIYRNEVTALVNTPDDHLERKVVVAMSAMREEAAAASRFNHPRHEGSEEQGLGGAIKAQLPVFFGCLVRQLHAFLCGTQTGVKKKTATIWCGRWVVTR